MKTIVSNVAKDFEKKLERKLHKNEIEFITWMVKHCNRDGKYLDLNKLPNKS